MSSIFGLFRRPKPPGRVERLWLGRDEWGRDRYLDLSGITGVTVGGLPRYGKTSLVNGCLIQLAPSPAVQFAFLDGKGSSDYEDWAPRAWLVCGDNIDQALKVLEQLHALMQDRQAQVRTYLGVKNGWHVGPSAGWPLIIVVIDECHSFFDEGLAETTAGKQKYRRAATLVMQLVKQSGSVMMTTFCLTQKQTGDAIPTKIRDVCTVGISFATKTRDAAVAALGEAIRDYPSMCPTTLQERPKYIGCCTAALVDTNEAFTRLRAPYSPEDDSTRVAAATAHLRRDPTNGQGSEPVAVPA